MLRQNQMIIYKCQNLNERMHSIDLAGLECRNYLVYRLLVEAGDKDCFSQNF